MRALLIAVAVSGTLIALSSTSAVAQTESQQTITVWDTDFSGAPPHKRKLKKIPVTDEASLEIDGKEVRTEIVWKTDFRGKPPFRRRYMEVPVVDAASLELEQAKQTSKRHRWPKYRFKRHP
ncbi:MAG: hypothetical protein OXE78_10455 [Gammaproteobacteria bacterium]|nr:hypothetical protein [Gammaproteobacteria bacterium]